MSNFAVIETKLDRVIKDVEMLNAKLEKKYITHEEHKLLEQRITILEKIVWAVVSTALLGILGAVLKLVLL